MGIKAKMTRKKKISLFLVGIGLAMVLVFAVYEAATYPWKTLFVRLGWSTLDDSADALGEPAPLPASAMLVDLQQGASTEEAVPTQPNFFASRPPMEITHLGSIKIPRIQISENVVEGSGDELLYGVGHVRGTAMPGQPGNCVLAGHRNYVIMRPFRYLDKMQPGDLVYVADANNRYTYEVFDQFEAEPGDVWILHEQEGESHLLTLLTCTPVLTYTNRLIVQCRLIETMPLL